MKCGTVARSTLIATGRWDARYNLAVTEYMAANACTAEQAIAALSGKDAEKRAEARRLRDEAAAKVQAARKLEGDCLT